MGILLTKTIKSVKVLFAVCVILFITFSCITVIERLVWVNADSYPAFLAKDLDSPALPDPDSIVSSIEYFQNVCGKDRGMMSFVTKDNGRFLRCDDSVAFDSWFKGVYALKFKASN